MRDFALGYPGTEIKREPGGNEFHCDEVVEATANINRELNKSFLPC